MSSTLPALFSAYRTGILDYKCLNELGLALKKSTEDDRTAFLESYTPNELHLQLLKLCAARNCGYHDILLEGIKAESKTVSRFCIGSPGLFQTNSKLLDVEFLLPFLQTLSHRARNNLIKNLGKYMPTEADSLFHAIVGIWGISIALPLLCKCSEELIKKELPRIHSLQTSHLMVLARRFPYLALAYLEKNSVNSDKAIKYIVRATLPESLNYCVTNNSVKLSKSTMKVILKKYSQVIMESPGNWARILNAKLVHKILNPELFEQFLSKQFLEIENDVSVQMYVLLKYFQLLLPAQVSSVMSKTHQIKYKIPFDSNFEFWKEHKDLLKLLDAKDRNSIASHLNAESKDNKWVMLMTCDKSVDIIKNDLRFEADGQARGMIFRKLMETVEINKDSKALEEVCKYVADRYRNDKNVLQTFFDEVTNLSAVSEETFSAVLALAHKFFDPSDWMTSGASKLFTFALQRDPDMYLKLFVEKWVSYSGSHMNLDNLISLKEELHLTCVNLAFTKENIKASTTDYRTRSSLLQFLPVISKWNEKSSIPVIYPNVIAFVLNLFARPTENGRYYQDESVVSFVQKKKNGFDSRVVESLLEKASTPEIIQHHLSKRLPFTNIKEIGDQMVKDVFKIGPFRYISVIQKMKKLGYLELLQYLAEKSKLELQNTSLENCKYPIFLLSLTTDNMDDFFSIIDPLLPTIEHEKNVVPPSEPKLDNLKETKKQEFIFKGIGLSFSHIDQPALAVPRLLKFCINGDLMLFVRDALYSVCRSLPHNAAQTVISSLVHKPVSVQKHALRLHQLVSNVQSRLDLLMNLLTGEGHITTRTILIQSAMSCLEETRSVVTWQVTKEMMSRLTPVDQAIVIWLVTADVPDPFVEEYFQIILEKVKLLQNVSADIIANTLQAICKKHTAVSETFLKNLLKEYFLAESFSETHHHNSLFMLLMVYLKGSKLSTIPSGLLQRQQFFVGLLESRANDTYINSYDSKLCSYTGRKRLIDFINTFCGQCLEKSPLKENETDLNMYTDILLNHLSHFDKHIFFKSSVMLSIVKMGKNSPDTIGRSIGELCDACFEILPSLAHYALPVVMKEYFKGVYCDSLKTSQLTSIMVDLLPPTDISEEKRMFRLVVLAHILPSGWISESSYAPFRELFLPLIKNTVVEFMLFSC